MELTTLKSIISNRLETILLKNLGKKARQDSNGNASHRATTSLKVQHNACNPGTLEICRKGFDEVQGFEARYSTDEWLMRSHMNDLRFKVSALVGKEVVFCVLDEENNLSEYRGVVAGNYSAGSALFKLEGKDEIFNSNFFAKIAVAA